MKLAQNFIRKLVTTWRHMKGERREEERGKLLNDRPLQHDSLSNCWMQILNLYIS